MSSEVYSLSEEFSYFFCTHKGQEAFHSIHKQLLQ